MGLASVVYPEAASSAEPLWGLAAIAWVNALVGTAELAQGESAPSPYGEWEGSPMTDD